MKVHFLGKPTLFGTDINLYPGFAASFIKRNFSDKMSAGYYSGKVFSKSIQNESDIKEQHVTVIHQ
jgi:hypothetical protein